MTDFSYLLKYFRTAAEQLEEYLLSDQLFWNLTISPPPGEPLYPNLTLGGLLLTEKQLQPLAATLKQATELQRIQNDIETTRAQWKVAWGKKASWEFKSRLNQWQNFINELRDNPEEFSGDYAYNVRLRVMLQLLQPEADDLSAAYFELLSSLDTFIQAKFTPGEFCWDAELAPEFPKDEYWYLWGDLDV